MDPMRRDSRKRLQPTLALAALAIAAGTSSACGYSDVAQQLNQKSRIETPGTRLVEGSFRNLQLAADNDGWYLFADTDAGRALTAFTVLDQKWCELPPITSYALYYRSATSPRRLLPYLTDIYLPDWGTLRFANLDCEIYDLVVPNAQLPFDGTSSNGFALRADAGLVLADPIKGTQRTLVTNLVQVQPVMLGSKSGWAVQGDDRVILFDADWNELTRLGDGVDNLLGGLYFTDRTGLYRIDGATASATSMQAGGCKARYGRGDNPTVLLYYTGCADQQACNSIPVGAGCKLVAWDETKKKLTETGVNADPDYTQFITLGGYQWVFTLRDVSDANYSGSLWAITPDGTETKIGDQADLDWAKWSEYRFGSPEQTRSSLMALVDVAGDAGRLIEWSPDGSTQELATGVWRWFRSGAPFMGGVPIVVNIGATAGDLATLCRQERCTRDSPAAQVVANNVRKSWMFVAGADYKTRGGAGASLAMADFDETAGTGNLIVAAPSLSAVRAFETIARGVPGDRFTLFSQNLFAGAAYLTAMDPATKTGRLEYRNLDLNAVGTVSNRVAEFSELSYPVAGLLYVVTEGAERGIWFAAAK
jgi:hypothetical protein